MTLIYIGFGIVVIASFITGIILTKKENKNSNNVSTNTSNNEVSTTLNNSARMRLLFLQVQFLLLIIVQYLL